jgi:hypothetical protein
MAKSLCFLDGAIVPNWYLRWIEVAAAGDPGEENEPPFRYGRSVWPDDEDGPK